VHDPFSASSPPIVEVRRLSRRFGTTTALDDVSLTVPRGGVFGLIGANGAGKTTLLKHLLGMLKAEAGSVQVFGLDPVANPVGVLGRIGYLSEDRDLPEWMRVRELMRYTQAFFPNWDEAYAEELREAFDLDPRARVRNLSRGQRARAGLLVALAHRPELLVLDEPSSGLDPVVRRDILGAIVRTIAEEGRTVLFSSHLLDEVERVADRVAILHQGRVMLTATMDEIKETHRRVTLVLPRPVATPPALVGAISHSGGGAEWTYVCTGESEQLRSAAAALGATVVGDDALTLDEIFVSHVTVGEGARRYELGASCEA
jgi:ABC-2 type transport system ATP-binding protein